jgi:hypothetical protein
MGGIISKSSAKDDLNGNFTCLESYIETLKSYFEEQLNNPDSLDNVPSLDEVLAFCETFKINLRYADSIIPTKTEISHFPVSSSGLNTEPKKKIIVFVDGIGSNFNIAYPTNIKHLYDIISSGMMQQTSENYLLKYFPAISPSSSSSFSSSATFSIDNTIRSIYSFLCDNYNEDDDLVFFGFSNGSLIVRGLLGLLRWKGISRKDEDLQDIYREYTTTCKNVRDGSSIPQQNNLSSYFLPHVSFVGLFDTVSYCPRSQLSRYDLFYHCEDSHPMIVSSCHIMATDISSVLFQNFSFFVNEQFCQCLENGPPNLDTLSYRENQHLEFRYPGSHADIGCNRSGEESYSRPCLTNNSLRFMLKASPCSPFLNEIKSGAYPPISNEDESKHVHGLLEKPSLKGYENCSELFKAIENLFGDRKKSNKKGTVTFVNPSKES